MLRQCFRQRFLHQSVGDLVDADGIVPEQLDQATRRVMTRAPGCHLYRLFVELTPRGSEAFHAVGVADATSARLDLKERVERVCYSVLSLVDRLGFDFM